ncbi:hypothetical protein B0A52_00988 [Exophiala mesophila]|uniref:Uncharacterized protein n=1 Tax=Exophiala mesophila TaxID=212818 RepID=A0A438NIT7_EXOME|nr:hypothetical protein B0A52_00988 [Exophiala mesophila]
MPARLVPPVLSLDAGKMHHIDPSNACSLMAMWSMFSKCSETLKDGHRLENMSWRVWSRESLCVTPVDSLPPRSSGVPSLSNSYSSDESDRLSDKDSCTINSRSRSFGQDDCASSLSRSRHLTSHTLEKIVVTIQEKADLCPLSPSIGASLPAPSLLCSKQPMLDEISYPPPSENLQDSMESCISETTAATNTTTRQSEHRDSDTSVSSDGLIRSGSVVHGFSPVTSSFRSRTTSAGLQPDNPTKLIPKKKSLKTAMFTLGGSSEDDDSSFEQRLLTLRPVPQKSSLSQSLSKGNLASQASTTLAPKRTSFRDVVAERRIQEDAENDEGAIESSDEEDDTDDIIESAIEEDDEDEGDWEDSNSDDGKAGVGEPIFRRVESRPDLVSRRSMLTLALNNGPSNLGHAYSQPALHRPRALSPTQSRDMAESPEDEDAMMMPASRRPPIAIPPPKINGKSLAHSPRTTRRNMLSTELTESLRKNLLWERQQKSQAANAFLKRSRNAQSMANLQAHTAPAVGPYQPPPAATADTSKNNSWNHYFDNPWEYNAKGW